MGTTTCAEINRRAVLVLQDAGLAEAVAGSVGAVSASAAVTQANIRWTEEEILYWITDAQRAITLIRPNSFNWVANVPLVTGVRQAIPEDGWLLLTVNANYADGEYGRAVTLATFDQMNRQFPNWRADKKAKTAYNYLFDLTDQKAFYVWPPNDGTGMVELNYSRTPPAVTNMDDTIAIDDIFVPPIVDYVLMRASIKDSEFGPGLQFAAYFQGLFTSQIGAKDAAEKEQNPDAALPPASNR